MGKAKPEHKKGASRRRKKSSLPKVVSQRGHAKKAILARYGIFCDRFLYKKICTKIQNGNSKLLLRQSHTRSLHKVILDMYDLEKSLQDSRTRLNQNMIVNDEVYIYVVYDKARGELNTALPWYESDAQLLADYTENHEYIRT